MPNIFLIICNFDMFFTFVLVNRGNKSASWNEKLDPRSLFLILYMSLFVCLFIQKCVVVQLVACELWYINVFVRDLQTMRAHSFLNFIFLVIKEKDELCVLSLESVTSIKKPINPLKVVYHPVSCLSHHYINLWMTVMVQMTAGKRLVDTTKNWCSRKDYNTGKDY